MEKNLYFISINVHNVPAGSIRQCTVLYDTLKYHQKCFQTLSTQSNGQKNVLQKVLTKKKNPLIGDLNPHPIDKGSMRYPLINPTSPFAL